MHNSQGQTSPAKVVACMVLWKRAYTCSAWSKFICCQFSAWHPDWQVKTAVLHGCFASLSANTVCASWSVRSYALQLGFQLLKKRLSGLSWSLAATLAIWQPAVLQEQYTWMQASRQRQRKCRHTAVLQELQPWPCTEKER